MTSNKKVCILYTGGTIGMVPTECGYAPKKDYFNTLLNQIHQMKSPALPSWKVIEFDPLLDSSNIAIDEWNNIGRAIAERYDEFDGFVVLHGTDTMSYTASALSFMLEGLNKPVIFTGAQIPLCELRTDGRDNLINSIIIAGEGTVREVCVYFGGKLLRANRSTKIASKELRAFDSPDYPALAEVRIDICYNESAMNLPSRPKTFHFTELQSFPIGVLKLFPGFQFELFEGMINSNLKAVVLEAFGSGNIPTNNRALVDGIRKSAENGTIITVTSQCHRGGTTLGTYATSNDLVQSGAISASDMTTEAAIAKLYYLFSCGYDTERVKLLMETNLRGEMNE